MTILTRNYAQFSSLIKKFESNTCTIFEAYNDIKELKFLDDVAGIKNYIESRIKKNDIETICLMKDKSISPTEYSLLQQCQPTSAAVERSFSQVKSILEKDRNFKEENIRDYAIINVNSQ